MSTTPYTIKNVGQKLSAQIGAQRAYIANIGDQMFVMDRTYGVFTIKPPESGQAFSITEVSPRRGIIDLGGDKTSDFPVTADDIAEDLVREINADAGADSFLGVFVCGPEGPTEEQMADARARLAKFYSWCVGEGDREWSRSHSMQLISELWVRAAKWLKLERDWATLIVENQSCPGCGTNLRPGVAVCKTCGAILDREKAISLGLRVPKEVAKSA